MIDHVSIAVRDLAACGAVLRSGAWRRSATASWSTRPATIGFGKKYPEFWLNERRDMTPADPDSGTHICLRASSVEAVRCVPCRGAAGGGASDGAPGLRPEYTRGYYAAFVRDPEATGSRR